MKLLLDDNVPLSVKSWFETKGYEVVKAYEVGLKGASDDKLYRFALKNNYKLITLDLDFGVLYFKYRKGTIIILRPKKLTPQGIISLLEKSFDKLKDKEGLIIVRPDKIRIRKL